MSLRILQAAALAILAAFLLAACEAPSSPDFDPEDSPPEVDTAEDLPEYAYRSPAALRGYKIAVKEADLLARLPCYCGCGQDPQYQNLRDCFLDDRGEFRAHGANCQVCLEEAEDAAGWKNEGLTPREIRERIDSRYEGRGQPTDTPPIAS